MRIKCVMIALTVMLVWPIFSSHQLQAKPIRWQRHAFPLPDSIWSVAAADTNADGSLDIIAMGQSQVFALAAPDWRPHVLIDTREPKMLYCVTFDADHDQQAYDLKATDLDADGRLDFLLAGRQSKNVVWYQNQE